MSLSQSTWCYIGLVTALSLSSVVATCPTWFFYDNTTRSCHCGSGLVCTKDGVEIQDGVCATSAGDGDQYYVGHCPFRHTVNNTNRMHSMMPSDPGLLDDVMCGPYNRKGLLCGECINGYGPTANLLEWACANCSKLSEFYTIPLYLVIDLLPVTLFFFCIALFKFNITSGPLLGYVLFCQVYLAWIKDRLYIHKYIESHESRPFRVVFKISLMLSQFWSLQCITLFVPSFCISDKLSDVHVQLLSLVQASYPIVLLSIIFILMYLYTKKCRLITTLWKLLTMFFTKIHIKPVTGDAVIHAFASFIFLSNVSVYITTGFLLDGMSISRPDFTTYRKSVYGYPTIELLSYQHVKYILIVLVPFTLLTVLPSVFHILYPTRIYRYLSKCISARKRLAITAFAEALQVCFKDGLDGTRDYRAVAGFITLCPVIFDFTQQFILKRLGFGNTMSKTINFVIAYFIIAYVQPCKSAIANISFSFNSLLLGGLYSVTHWWLYDSSIPTDTQILTFLLIPLMSHGLVFVWAGYTLTSYIIRHHVNPRGSRRALVNMCLHRRRRRGYQEMT